MMIKLAYDHGTLNPVVKRIFIRVAADPAEVRLVKMLFDLSDALRSGAGGEVECELLDDSQYKLLLFG